MVLSKELPDSTNLWLSCGQCLGCRAAYAKGWALRNLLEFQLHPQSLWTTLTYDEKHLPPSLQKLHLSVFFRKLRKRLGSARPIRFFASGEYGEKNGRPHYHAIIYGLNAELLATRSLIENTWDQGDARQTVSLTPAAIAYTAGYVAKKIGFKQKSEKERLDPDTGELYYWQAPFLQMSRRPGIGGHARQWPQSWRLYAVNDGYKMPVPRFLHESWKAIATPQDLEDLNLEKIKLSITREPINETRLRVAEQLLIAQQLQKAERRSL